MGELAGMYGWALAEQVGRSPGGREAGAVCGEPEVWAWGVGVYECANTGKYPARHMHVPFVRSVELILGEGRSSCSSLGEMAGISPLPYFPGSSRVTAGGLPEIVSPGFSGWAFTGGEGTGRLAHHHVNFQAGRRGRLL